MRGDETSFPQGRPRKRMSLTGHGGYHGHRQSTSQSWTMEETELSFGRCHQHDTCLAFPSPLYITNPLGKMMLPILGWLAQIKRTQCAILIPSDHPMTCGIPLRHPPC